MLLEIHRIHGQWTTGASTHVQVCRRHDSLFSEPKTYLLHDTSLALGKGNVATRLVADELDFDFAALAAALVIVIIIVIGRGRAGALDTAGFVVVDIAIAHGMRVVQLGGRGLFVLIGDVGHFGM